MQEGTTCFQSVVTKHSTCSDNIKIWEQETYISSSLIVLMHARLMVLSAHACTERESALINAGSPSHICDFDQPDYRL